ncbi:hypothetical protein [Chitinophaga nivalis]|uniref:Uncharacterized protein n=1 Tax=Chitinophaga nivalis TaxID=2991709 RepID=A0ABT3IK10_9BACT|nr:hypothetical protein [Chitinophaga nivalis]MCW3466002.1 hypothetical protein [Chitinophaga nivalis]MCW3484307.1 hypothetical protein [Chitinophaga nivalis]
MTAMKLQCIGNSYRITITVISRRTGREAIVMTVSLRAVTGERNGSWPEN